jgi:fibronectin type 3 domain-containing protein
LHYITSEFIDPKIDDIVPTPDGISINPLNNSANIKWARNLEVLQSGRAVNYNIYRADNINGPYLIVNFADMFQGVLSGEEVEVDTNYFNFLDANLINGKTYYYYLTGVNTFGFESQRSTVYEVVPSDNRVPLAPGDITINEFGGRLKLSWRNISRVRPKGYEIYKSIGDTDKFVKVFPTLDAQYDAGITSWTDADVREGEFYSYYFISIGQTGARSESSDTITFIIDDYIPPAAPVGVVAIGDTGAIKLSWEANTEHDLLGYQIERSSDSRFATRFLVNEKPITTTEFIDTVRRESQSDIAYFIYALDKSYNRSAPSERVVVRVIDVVPPLTPEMTTIYEEDDKYLLIGQNHPILT